MRHRRIKIFLVILAAFFVLLVSLVYFGGMWLADRGYYLPAYLGEAPLGEMVEQIRRAVGKSGTNAEYVVELARALRELGESDAHVFELERQILAS